MNVHLLTIDPQNDFCFAKNPVLAKVMKQNGADPVLTKFVEDGGSLFVAGADEDMKRLAAMINRVGSKINDIHVTLDSHRTVDIAHPIFHKNSSGKHPDIFTIITDQDYENGTWQSTNPAFGSRTLEYARALKNNGRYPLCIWPEHCIIGTIGHAVYPELAHALSEWERTRFAAVDYVTKGSNIFTEHYSAVQSDVPDPSDPTTMLNTRLIDILQSADLVAITGEALSHCVKFTVEDIANNFGVNNIKKLILLEDTCSAVTGFEQQANDFVKDMVKRGMGISKSTEFLK